jgi:cytochrome b6-f complex iron-sulfur subunit
VKQQQRRVFLKVIAVSPLIGCSGVDPSAPGGFDGVAGNAAGGSSGSGNHPSLGGGGNTAQGAGGRSGFSGAGNSSPGGGTSTGGSPVATGGSFATGGAPPSAGASAAGAAGAKVDPNDPSTPIGNVSAYPLGSFVIAGSIYLMGHDAGGLYAMSMQCTHAGCAVEMQGAQLYCPCHFSRFDHLGNVVNGPANKPLPHYKVTVDATGNITVDRFTIVSMTARTPV